MKVDLFRELQPSHFEWDDLHGSFRARNVTFRIRSPRLPFEDLNRRIVDQALMMQDFLRWGD